MNLDPEPERATDLDAWRSVAQGDAEDRDALACGKRVANKAFVGGGYTCVLRAGHTTTCLPPPIRGGPKWKWSDLFGIAPAHPMSESDAFDALAAKCADLQRRLDAVTALADEARADERQQIMRPIRVRLDRHNYDDPWDKGYKVGLRDAMVEIARRMSITPTDAEVIDAFGEMG